MYVCARSLDPEGLAKSEGRVVSQLAQGLHFSPVWTNASIHGKAPAISAELTIVESGNVTGKRPLRTLQGLEQDDAQIYRTRTVVCQNESM